MREITEYVALFGDFEQPRHARIPATVDGAAVTGDAQAAIGEMLNHTLSGLLLACLSVARCRNVVRQRLGQLLAGAAIDVAEGENAAGDGRLNRRARGCEVARHHRAWNDAAIEHRYQDGLQQAGLAFRRQFTAGHQQDALGEADTANEIAQIVATNAHAVVGRLSQCGAPGGRCAHVPSPDSSLMAACGQSSAGSPGRYTSTVSEEYSALPSGPI